MYVFVGKPKLCYNGKPSRNRCRRESKQLQRWLCTLCFDRSENRRDVRQTLGEIAHITFAGSQSTESTRQKIQNNCANIRDIVNDTLHVDQMSHYHVPGEIVKGEIAKGEINQANLQQAKCR